MNLMNLRRTLLALLPLLPPLAVAAVVLSGCSVPPLTDTWSSRVEERPWVPPPPPQILRKQADFRIYDPPSQKEYFMYSYQDDYMNETLVTVIDYTVAEVDRREVLSLPDEHLHAINLFRGMWKNEGNLVKLNYFNKRHKEEKDRYFTLIDQKIRFKMEEIRTFLEEQMDLEADFASRRDTENTFPDGDETFKLPSTAAVEREILVKKFRINVSDAQLMILQYKRLIRDTEYARKRDETLFFRTEHRVADLITGYMNAATLMESVRINVAAESWVHPQASLRINEVGTLIVVQRRNLLDKIKPLLDQLRIEKIRWQKEQAEKAAAAAPAPASP